jgi:hypothetical protein
LHISQRGFGLLGLRLVTSLFMKSSPGNPGFYRHRQLWRVQFVARVADQNRLAQKQDKKIGACPLLGFSQRFLVDLASASPRTLASGPSTAAAGAERTDSGELAAALVSIRAM